MKTNIYWNRAYHRMAYCLGFLCLGILTATAATLTVKQDGTGNFTTVQAALDAANAGDTVEVYGGVYTEDITIGHFNIPSLKKDNLTLRSAAGQDVEIRATNTEMRLAGLAAAGFDPGPADHMGFTVHSNGAVIEGIRFVQPDPGLNLLGVGTVFIIGSSNVTVRNCEIVGPGAETPGDSAGLAVSILDVFGITQGSPTLATNVTIENCKFTDIPYAFVNKDLLQTGFPGEVTVRNCEFFNNQNGVEIDDGTQHFIDCYFHDNATGIHLSDDTTTISNCVIENNLEHGLEIDNQDDEDNDPPNVPIVTVDHTTIRHNGTNESHRGISMEVGTLTLSYSIIADNTGNNVLFEGEQGRQTICTFDHCDLYQSGAGTAILAPESVADVITFTMTNSIIVDQNGVENGSIGLGDFSVTYSDLFVSGTDFTGDFLLTQNNVNVDPLYVDPANGNFALRAGSPVATSGANGTFMGSQGLATRVGTWMVY